MALAAPRRHPLKRGAARRAWVCTTTPSPGRVPRTSRRTISRSRRELRRRRARVIRAAASVALECDKQEPLELPNTASDDVPFLARARPGAFAVYNPRRDVASAAQVTVRIAPGLVLVDARDPFLGSGRAPLPTQSAFGFRVPGKTDAVGATTTYATRRRRRRRRFGRGGGRRDRSAPGSTASLRSTRRVRRPSSALPNTANTTRCAPKTWACFSTRKARRFSSPRDRRDRTKKKSSRVSRRRPSRSRATSTSATDRTSRGRPPRTCSSSG